MFLYKIIVVNGISFETWAAAAKHLGVSTRVLRHDLYAPFDEFDTHKKFRGFPLFVNGFGQTFRETRSEFNMDPQTLNEIIMGSKEFVFQGVNHRIRVAKPVQMVYDPKKCWEKNIIKILN